MKLPKFLHLPLTSYNIPNLPPPHALLARAAPTCHNPSFYFANISYQAHVVYSTPAHLAVSYAELNFNLSNSGAYDAVCTADSSGGPSSNDANYFQTPILYDCDAQAGASDVSGNVTFSYSGYNRALEVNETWTCDDLDYFANVKMTLPFECNTTVWQNPNFTWPDSQGQLYRTENVVCEPVDIDVNSDTVAANTVQLGKRDQ